VTKSEKNTVLRFGKIFQASGVTLAIPLYSAIGYFPSVSLLFLSFVVDHVVVVFIVTLNLDIFFPVCTYLFAHR